MGVPFLIGQTNLDPNAYYPVTTTINNITLADASLNLNTHKLTNIGDATQATDALNR